VPVASATGRKVRAAKLLQRGLGDIRLASHARGGGQHPVGADEIAALPDGVEIFRGIELRLDCGDDGLGDLVLHCENVGEIAVVALRQNVAAGGDIVKLRCDAHSIAALANAALDHIADAELLGDLLHVDVRYWQPEARGPQQIENARVLRLGQRPKQALG
jgi:hypothetical protein